MNAVTNRMLSHATMPLLTAAATVASAAGVLWGPSPAAIAGGILLGFLLPGLALTEILFRHRTLSPVERTVLAPALSLATLIISGLVLYVAGVRLDRTSWTLAAAGVTLVALALAALPRRVTPDEGAVAAEPAEQRELVGAETVRIHLASPGEAATEFIPVIRDGDPPPPGRMAPQALPGPFAPWSAQHKVEVRQLMRQLLPMIMVVAVLAGAGYLSFVSSRASYDVTVTTLSAAPPGAVNAAGNRVVEVTASGLIAGNGPYDLLVTDAAGTTVLERVIAVDADGTWSAALTLPSARRLTVGLFRAGDTSAYRTLLIAAAP
jgi:hypothetical protein